MDITIQTSPALLILDMQRWFFQSAEARARLPGLLAGINDLADYFHECNLPVIHVLTASAPETEPLPDVRRNEHDIVISMMGPSAFSGTELENRLWELDVNTVVLAGFSTNACVGLTAIDAYERDFMPVLAGDAIPGINKEREDDMLRVLEHEYGVIPVSNERIKELLGGE